MIIIIELSLLLERLVLAMTLIISLVNLEILDAAVAGTYAMRGKVCLCSLALSQEACLFDLDLLLISPHEEKRNDLNGRP